MARPVYPYELADPDFCWLITNFQENNPEYICIDHGTLPVVFIGEKEEFKVDDVPEEITHRAAEPEAAVLSEPEVE